MEWISVKEISRLPSSAMDLPYSLLFHTLDGVGVGWIWRYEEEWVIEQAEEEYQDKYICTFNFIKNKLDGNNILDIDEIFGEPEHDVFEHSPHFPNIGTVTHWMPLPKPPKK